MKPPTGPKESGFPQVTPKASRRPGRRAKRRIKRSY